MNETRDFFISYNKTDKAIAKWVAKVLEDNGFSIYIQANDIRQSDDFIMKMSVFLENSENFIAVYSVNYFISPYCSKEWSVAFDRHLNDNNYKFIGLKTDDVVIPQLLATTVYLDSFAIDDKSKEKLLQSVSMIHVMPETTEIKTINKDWIDGYDDLRLDFPATNNLQKQFEFIKKLKNMREEMPDYAALPLSKLYYIKEICSYFDGLMYAINKEGCDNSVELIYEYIWLEQKCYLPLYDNRAEKIDEIINNVKPQSSFELQWGGLAVALLIMYRMDSRIDDFLRIAKLFEDNYNIFNDNNKADFQIEIAKFHLGVFDKQLLLSALEKIPTNISYSRVIKKISLLILLAEKEEANLKLKEITEIINKNEIHKDVKASYFGYINICFRALGVIAKKDSAMFSDEECLCSDYNIRNVLNSSKDKLMTALVEVKGKDVSESKAFNPNVITNHYGTTIETKNRDRYAWAYFLLYDDLCLPIFRDHKHSLKETILFLDNTSLSKLWRWSFLLRTNDEKIINEFFSRIYVFNSEVMDISLLYEKLLILYNEKNFNQYRSIVKFEIIIDVIARISLKIPKEMFIEFLKDFIILTLSLDTNQQPFIQNAIIKSLTTMSYHVDKEMLFKLKSELMTIPINGIDPISLNDYIKFKDFTISTSEYNKLFKNIKNENSDIKKSAILRLPLIFNSITPKRYDKIKSILWGESENLPFCKDLYPFIWEKLPHPNHIDFSDKYKEYLLNHSIFNTGVLPKGIFINGNQNVNIENFVYIFGNTSSFGSAYDISKIKWSSKELTLLIKKVKNYSIAEKSNFDESSDWFFEESNTRYFCLITCYIGREALLTGIKNKRFWSDFKKIQQIFIEVNFDTFDLNFIQELRLKHTLSLETKVQLLRHLYCDNKKLLKCAVESFVMIFLYRVNESNDFTWVVEQIKTLLIRLPYLDFKCMGAIIGQINTRFIEIIEKYCFQEALNTINDCFVIIKESVGLNKHDEYFLDTMLNLSHFAKKIYNYCVNKNIDLPEHIINAKDYFIKHELPEARNIWID